MKKVTLLILLSICHHISFSQVYLDSTAAVQDRVDNLLSLMTLEEKVAQMMQEDVRDLETYEDIGTYALGSIISVLKDNVSDPNHPTLWANTYDSLQTEALKSRLGIPLMIAIDAVHGHSAVKETVIFPHNSGLGCSWNPDLIEEVTRITAIEMAATGYDWTFSPVVAVPQDEHWGRTYEGFSENPDLVRVLGAAAVRGYQGGDLSDSLTVAACAKHYIADGGTTDGIDRGNAEIDDQTLRDIHLPGYEAAVEEGVATVMTTFSLWNGEKVSGNKYLLTDVLKGELGFEGFIITDFGDLQAVDPDYDTAVMKGINAGIDMSMNPPAYKDGMADPRNFIGSLVNLVNAGRVSQSRIDDAVRRILRKKFELGLFEHPFAHRSLLNKVGSPEHREVGRRAVRESIVLLKNDNDILPLSKSITNIHMAGSHADNLGWQCGGWSITWLGGQGDITTGTTVKEAMETVVPGAQVTTSVDGSGATGADVGIIVVGERPYTEITGDVPGNFYFNLNLTNEASVIMSNMKAAGIPVVVIVMSGRPVIINSILDEADAIIAAFWPGTEALGISDVMFGDYNFTGRLSYTWPISEAQIPINFGDNPYIPLFEYGYGERYPWPANLIFNLDMKLAMQEGVFLNNDTLQVEVSADGNHTITMEDLDQDSIYSAQISVMDTTGGLTYKYVIKGKEETINYGFSYVYGDNILSNSYPISATTPTNTITTPITKTQTTLIHKPSAHCINGKLYFRNISNSTSIVIYDLQGQKVWSEEVSEGNYYSNKGSFKNGLYIVKIYSDSATTTEKIYLHYE